MHKDRSRLTAEAAAERLRAMSLDVEEGALLGSEEALIAALGVSRATVRQVARMLEREGLLRVRRGINGGYFSARPDLQTIEATVSAYLDVLKMDATDVARVASVLWVEVMRQAAGVGTEAARSMSARLQARVGALRPGATHDELMRVEQETRKAVFDLIDGRYVELIFQINVAFAYRRSPAIPEASPLRMRAFVIKWKAAKLMELRAIADGDPELGMMAARHSRNLWDQRLAETRAAETELARPTAATAPVLDVPVSLGRRS